LSVVVGGAAPPGLAHENLRGATYYD
jgi:hypothetical protein